MQRSIGRLAAAATVSASVFLAASVAIAEDIKLTIVTGHPPTSISVKNLRDVFVPGINRKLEGSGHRIEWTQAYAGSVAKPPEVFEAIEKGIGDVGYVVAVFEADKLPMEQITYVTPFGSNDVAKVIGVVEKTREAVPEMNEAYRKHRQMLIAHVPVDTYHILTAFPFHGLADLQGHKISVGGIVSRWLEGTGAVVVSQSLPQFYNSMQSGLTEGTVIYQSGIGPYKLYEVAQYITEVGLGAQFTGAITVNTRRWEAFPDAIKKAFHEVSSDYQEAMASDYAELGRKSMETAAANNATISELPAVERLKYAKSLPNIAQEWASNLDKSGLPGSRLLKTYMDNSRKAGIEHARAWDKE